MANRNKWLPHPLAGSSIANLARVLRRHRRHIELRYWPRMLATMAAVVAATPLRIYEQLRHGRAIAKQPIDQPPIMILGHWRSGTTNLHNLLLCDERFASVSLLHCSIPHLHLTLGGMIGRILGRRLPESRPMDAVPLGIHEPMSEDFGLVGCSDQTHYGSYFFPQHALDEFERTVLFAFPDHLGRWERDYLSLLQRVTYESNGKRLCLKNPPNAGRVRHVLNLFPEAKFVFVRRNPYLVHASTCRLMKKFLQRFAFQSWDREQIERFVSVRYERLMRKWLLDRSMIPPENLLELAHEDIVADPIGTVRSVYSAFGLDSFQKVEVSLEARVNSQAAYRNNQYVFEPDYIKRIEPHVRFMVDEWGYEPP